MTNGSDTPKGNGTRPSQSLYEYPTRIFTKPRVGYRMSEGETAILIKDDSIP